MSGPKYYTVTVNDGENAMEVYRRMSNFQQGVIVTVRGNKLDFTVSNDAWLKGVDRSFLEKQVKAAERELSNERRLAELLRKSRQDEIRWAEEMRSRINESYEAACQSMESEIDRVRGRVEAIPSSIPSQICNIDLSPEKDKLLTKLEARSKDYKTISQQRDKLLRELDEYSSRISSAESLDKFNKVKKKRPRSRFESRFDLSEISKLEQSANILKARADDVVKRLSKLDAELNKEPLNQYKDRIVGRIKTLNLLSEDAFSNIDGIIGEIRKEHQARMEDLRRMQEESRSQSEIESMNRALDSLREILVNEREDYLTNVDVHTDASGENGALLGECRSLIEQIESKEYLDKDLTERLEDSKATLETLAFRIKTASATKHLQVMKTDLTELEVDSEECSKKYAEYQEARDHYLEAYGRFISVFGSENKAFEDMRQYINLTDSVFSMRSADTVIADLREYTDEILSVCEKALKEQTYNLLCTTFNQSEDSEQFEASKKDGEKHTYFVKKDKAYRGVLFDICKSDQVSVSPRMVELSNGRRLITPDGLQKLYDSCGWSKEMEEQCGDYLVGVTATEAPQEVRQAMSSAENIIQLTEEQSRRYLEAMGYTEQEMAEWGYPVSKSRSGGAGSTASGTVEKKQEMRMDADR